MAVATWLAPADKAAALARLCHYERRVLRQKMLDWKQWASWCEAHSIKAHEAAAGEVHRFFVRKKRGTVATRFWDALRWTQLHLQTKLTMPSRPRRAAVKGVVAAARQAVVLEPEMLRRLELWIEVNKGNS